MSNESLAGRVFTITVNAMGALVSLAAFVLWQADDPGHYMFLLALALLASGWRVGQMSYPGTASIGFVFITISLAEFSGGCTCRTWDSPGRTVRAMDVPGHRRFNPRRPDGRCKLPLMCTRPAEVDTKAHRRTKARALVRPGLAFGSRERSIPRL